MVENAIFKTNNAKSSWHYGEEFFEVEGYKFNEKELTNLRRFCFQTNIMSSYEIVNNIENQTAKVTVIRRIDGNKDGPFGVKKTLNLVKKSKVKKTNFSRKFNYFLKIGKSNG